MSFYLKYRFYSVLIIFLFSIISIGCNNYFNNSSNENITFSDSGIVTKVIDGDTVTISFDNGIIQKVRFVGIDTPEISQKNDVNDWFNVSDSDLKTYGYLAKDYITEKLLNQRVELKYDVLAGNVDQFGRVLAYVYIDGENINMSLIEEGLARTYIEGNSEQKYLFIQQQSYAMKSCKGVWTLKCQN